MKTIIIKETGEKVDLGEHWNKSYIIDIIGNHGALAANDDASPPDWQFVQDDEGNLTCDADTFEWWDDVFAMMQAVNDLAAELRETHCREVDEALNECTTRCNLDTDLQAKLQALEYLQSEIERENAIRARYSAPEEEEIKKALEAAGECEYLGLGWLVPTSNDGRQEFCERMHDAISVADEDCFGHFNSYGRLPDSYYGHVIVDKTLAESGDEYAMYAGETLEEVIEFMQEVRTEIFEEEEE